MTFPRDRLARPLRDLRVSVTDRCNFRCSYCMPKEVFGPGYAFLPRQEILTFEEITRLTHLLWGEGVVRKVRLTGGEPLLRRELPELVRMLAALPGLDLSLTTNGALLAEGAASLAAAGLRRVSVSLDAVDDAVFRRMNDVDFPVGRVLEGIDAAAAAGLSPVKVNAVVVRGINDHALLDLVRHFKGSGHVLRLIEYMDVGHTNAWRLDQVVPAREILDRIHGVYPLVPVAASYRGEVARRWRFQDGSGEIGVISSVTQPFCGDCTRLRLSADGKLFTCLFATTSTDLRGPMRAGATDEALLALVAALWQRREDRYSELRATAGEGGKRVEMSYLGG